MLNGPGQNNLAWSGPKEAGLNGTICFDKYINNQLQIIRAHSDLGFAQYGLNGALLLNCESICNKGLMQAFVPFTIDKRTLTITVWEILEFSVL